MVNPGRKSGFLSDCSIVGNVAEIKVMRGSSLYSNTSLCPLAHCYSLQEGGRQYGQWVFSNAQRLKPITTLF